MGAINAVERNPGFAETRHPKGCLVNCVASSLPGRIRLRHAALRNPDRLARLQRSIAAWPQVRAVSVNEKAGSLLINYDAAALRENDCARRCEVALAEVLPARTEVAPAPPRAATPAQARSGAPRVRANRIAKRAMLASLAASLLLAAMGAKRWHIGTGIAFLHALGVHLWVHRRNLVR